MRGVLFALLFFALPLIAGANLLPTLEAPISLQVVPQSPKPGDIVRIEAKYSGENAIGASYVWRVNGAVVDQGVGVRAVTVTLPSLGGSTTVSVSISESGIVRGEASTTIRPADVDIVWEGSVPLIPFVERRGLANGDSTITASAIPHIVRGGARVSASDLVYTWTVNRSSTPFRSGYGLQTVSLTTPQFENPFSLGVRVATREGDIVAEDSVVIRPVRPSILFYERPPLLGLRYDQELGDGFVLQEEEGTVMAFPVDSTQALSLEWRANGREIEPEEDPRMVTFRKTGEGRGYFTIELTATGFQALFERARESFLLTF